MRENVTGALFVACDQLRILADTFEDVSLGGRQSGLDHLTDQEWLRLRPQITHRIRQAAEAARRERESRFHGKS